MSEAGGGEFKCHMRQIQDGVRRTAWYGFSVIPSLFSCSELESPEVSSDEQSMMPGHRPEVSQITVYGSELPGGVYKSANSNVTPWI